MDPRDPHFTRSRYDPSFHRHTHDLSDPPDDYYPHPHPHPHPHPPLPPLPPPPLRQHRLPRDDHHNHPDYDPRLPLDDHHNHPDYDPRLYLPHPQFDPRSRPRPVIRGPHPPPEPWVGPADDRKARSFDDRRSRSAERYWVREDEALQEDFRVRAHQQRQQQQLRFLEEHPAGHRRFEQVPPDEREFEYSSRFVRPGFVPNRGGETRPGFDRPPIVDVPDEVAIDGEVGYRGDRYIEDQYMINRGKRKMLDVCPEDTDYNFREDHFVGGTGKRRNFNGGNFQYDEWNSTKRPVQKASAFGRIQSGVSVWSRIEEKPASPYVDLDDIGFLEENQPDVDNLDLSYKSNGLVAKVVGPSSSSPTPSEAAGKGLKVVRPKDRVKGKKVDNDREKVVVSVGSSVPIPGVASPSLSPESVGKGLKVVRPKDRVKMMKVDKDREKVVVLLGSSMAIPGVASQTPPPKLVGKGLKVVTLKDRVKKKKVDTDRERVVVSVGSSVASPGVVKGIADPKKLKGKSPLKDPDNSEGSEKIVHSSSKPLQGTSCSEESKKVVIAPSKTSSGLTPQSSSKRRAIASSSEKTEVGASTKPVSKKESSPNLVSNELDGLEKTIDFKREIVSSGNIANGASSEPLPRKESNPLQDSNHSEGSVMIGDLLCELASGVGLRDSKVVSPPREIGSSTQLLSRKQNSPLQGFNPSEGSEKILVSSSKSLSSPSGTSLEPASDVGNLRTENTTQDFSSSLGSEKILVSSSKPSTGSKLKSSSKRTIAASRKPASGASTEPLFIVDSNPVHFSNETEGSEKVADSSSKPSNSQKSSKRVIASSGKDASGASSKNSSKRAIKVSPAKQRAAKRAAKTFVKVENHINEDSGQGAKASKGKLTDVAISQLCQPGTINVMESIEDSAAEQKDVNLVQDVGIEDTREEESSIPNEKIDQNSCYPLVSDSAVAGDPNSEPFAQEVTTIRTPSLGIDSIGNDIIEDPSKGVRLAADDVSSLAQSDTGLGLSSFDEFSSFASVGNAAVIRSVTESSTGEHGTFNRSKMKRKREILEEQQILEIPAVSEELEILPQRMPEDDVLLPSEVSSLVLAQSSLNYATNQEECGPSLVSSDGLRPSDSTATPDEILPIPTNDRTGEIKEQPSPLHLSQFNTFVDVSTFQDALNFMDTIRSNSKLSESNCSSDNDGSNNQDENPTNKSSKADETMQSHEPVFDKTQLLSSREYKEEFTTDAKLTEGKSFDTKTILSSGVPSIFQNRINSSGSSKGTTRKNPNVRSKTWHRSDASSSASQSCGNLQYGIGSYKEAQKKQSPKKLGRVVNSSYVRKGNSLVRKPTNEVLPPRPPHGLGASSRSSYHLTESSISLGYKSNNPNHTTANPSFERPKTPPLPSGSKLPNCSMDPLKDSAQPMSEDPIPEAGIEVQGMKLDSQALDLVSASLCKQSIPSSISSESLTRKRMIYVKHKSNQLVAAPQPAIGNGSSNPTEKAQKSSSSTSSDLYYKRKKNQLILNALSSDSQQKQDVDSVNFDDQGASKVSSCNTTGLFKKRLDKVLRKTKHSKFSRVWTLHGGQQGKKGFTAANLSKVAPYLFPWKRTYRQISSSKQSLSLIRNLQFTRRRDMIYKVSTDGFSLRKAGVVSIGGASLKWSKSIEKHSKKANEEATLAVAEVERRKRERESSSSIHSRKKNKNSLPRKSTFGIQLKQGERIFRVGSVRYKMDSSKRTLVRVPDESPTSVGQQSAKNTFVPRRLLIGNDEYIRKGNGNQLVRDPKKLVRILASEKVRWSLHTVRSRLAKKQQYCQFFTRFGKCNKSSGKCPYMHDPAKVAICTKFLRGVCSDSNCKLTHKILPERMPDCSYFLQGICTNIQCPYRHVNVNPNASVCDGFLRGYCADGDECRKKHSYVCPHFEATGKCAEGSKCKLHHPKSQKKSKKRKRTRVPSSSKGRYFGFNIVKVGEPLVVVSDKNDDRGGDALFSDGWAAEFISIDPGSDYDEVEANSPEGSSSKELKDDLDMQSDDLDLLIKPIRIMNRPNLTNALEST